MFSLRNTNKVFLLFAAAGFAFAVSLRLPFHVETAQADEKEQSAKARYLIQGLALEQMVELVHSVKGQVSHHFPMIDAIAVTLTDNQLASLSSMPSLTITQDRTLSSHSRMSVGFDGYPFYAIRSFASDKTGAADLHKQGLTGKGVGIAILDSGIAAKFEKGSHLRLDSEGKNRRLTKFDAIKGAENRDMDDDLNGHGSHVAGVIASSVKDDNRMFNGIAPDASLISVRAFNEEGEGTYIDVINGLEWIVQSKDRLNIRVVNLSFGATAQSDYWADPLNQAVLKTVEAGIVVVASAGNDNGSNSDITLPGNIPDVITVGTVMGLQDTSKTQGNDATGLISQAVTKPRQDKPELVSWGGHLLGNVSDELIPELEKRFELIKKKDNYYVVSGSSQAAAVVTGTVALMIQNEPSLSPDAIKCRLMSTSERLVSDSASPRPISVGLSNAFSAVTADHTACDRKTPNNIARALIENSDVSVSVAKGGQGG